MCANSNTLLHIWRNQWPGWIDEVTEEPFLASIMTRGHRNGGTCPVS